MSSMFMMITYRLLVRVLLLQANVGANVALRKWMILRADHGGILLLPNAVKVSGGHLTILIVLLGQSNQVIDVNRFFMDLLWQDTIYSLMSEDTMLCVRHMFI